MPGSEGSGASARIRLMGDGFAYASPGIVSEACRHSLTLVFAVGEAPIEVHWRRGTAQGRALLVAPLVSRRLQAPAAPVVLIDLEPIHAEFRRLALASGQPGVQCLPAAQVQPLHQVAQDFFAGGLSGPELDSRIRSALGVFASQFPAPGPLDPRVAWMMRAMNRDTSMTLARLADALSLSTSCASRLFSAQMGIPSRAYAMAVKVRAAARFMGSDRSLTEVALAAGFADSAHFAKVWLRSFGAPPSRYFPARQTEIDAAGLPDWANWTPPKPAADAAIPRPVIAFPAVPRYRAA